MIKVSESFSEVWATQRTLNQVRVTRRKEMARLKPSLYAFSQNQPVNGRQYNVLSRLLRVLTDLMSL